MTWRPCRHTLSFGVSFLLYFLNRVRREKAHMRKLFGDHNSAYPRRTARLVPATC
jgi:protein-S-isoprenylcysteine O-methyltransferase Ste14